MSNADLDKKGSKNDKPAIKSTTPKAILDAQKTLAADEVNYFEITNTRLSEITCCNPCIAKYFMSPINIFT